MRFNSHDVVNFCQDNCRLIYAPTDDIATGFYGIAIQVEDFINASSTVAMSSVPVQFVVELQDHSNNVFAAPTFVGTTPVDGSCITVGSTYQQQITARSGGDSAT